MRLTCKFIFQFSLWLVIFWVNQVVAQDTALAPDVRLVIDVSGSMKQNDPNNLRQPAVELLVQLLPEKSKAGIWTFGKWVNMLVPHKDVEPAWREDALQKSDQINSVGLFTNIGEALEKAAYDADSGQGKYRISIILLTDGMVDIDKDPEINKKEWRRIVDEVLPKIKRSGITIHTIALSDIADVNLLNKLSLSTDGIAAIAKTADDLMKIFLKAFDVAVPAEQVPLSDEGFVIDSSVEEFTALIFRKHPEETTQLIGPDEELITASSQSKYIKWYRDGKYDLITVKQPLEGQWIVKADMDPESRITVVSNLNLRVRDMPVNQYINSQFDVNYVLQEDGKTITNAEFLTLMDATLTLSAGKDEFDLREYWKQQVSGEKPPANGAFGVALPPFEKEGIYQLSVVVDGKSFVREFTHQFYVRQPFGAEIKHQLNEGRLEYRLLTYAYGDKIDPGQTQVIATVFAPDRGKKIYSLNATEKDTWQTRLMPDTEGEYVAKIKIRGKNIDGESFDVNLDDVTFRYSIDEGFVEEEKPFFEQSPTPTPTPEPSPSPSPTPKQTPVPVATAEPPQEESGIPGFVLYGLLIFGNILLFGLGFFVVKKIIGPKDDSDILEEYSEEKVGKKLAEPEAEMDVPEMEEIEDIEEEPPMEDLEPLEETPEPALEPEKPQADMSTDLDADLSALLDDDEAAAGQSDENVEDLQALTPEIDSIEEPMDELDDLDAMAMEDEAPDGGDALEEMSEEDEEEDMVSAMLKAQGLDLAEDELDDAISSLIEDLENDDSLGGDDMDDFDLDDDQNDKN